MATYSFPSLFLFFVLFQKDLLLVLAIYVSLLNFDAFNFKFKVFMNRRFSKVDFFFHAIFMTIIPGRLSTFFCDSIHTSCGVNTFMNMKFQFSKFADHEFNSRIKLIWVYLHDFSICKAFLSGFTTIFRLEKVLRFWRCIFSSKKIC